MFFFGLGHSLATRHPSGIRLPFSMRELTPKQREVLTFIQRFSQTHAFPPTRGEIAEGLGLRNRQGVDQHLRALEAKGALELVPGISRGIRVHEESSSSVARTSTSTNALSLPLLGRIAAGAPILAAENIDEEVTIDPALFTPHADFLLRVRGDSMKNADILDRDLLVVHRTSQAREGQIVVARIEDEATVKYYSREGNMVRLKAANPDYSPIEINLRKQNFTIEGLAVGVLRTRMGRP